MPNFFHSVQGATRTEKLQRDATGENVDSDAIATQEVGGTLEVEQKFRCTDAILRKLEELSCVQCQKLFTDVYFDTVDLVLTKKDMWLRSREGHLELKTPHNIQETSVSLYMEVSNHREIAALLKCSEIDLRFEQAIASETLAAAGVRPFAKIETCRSRHKVQIDANAEVPCSPFTAFVDIDQAAR